MDHQAAQNLPKLTLQYQWSSSLHAQMKYSQISQPTDLPPLKSSSSSALGTTFATDGCDAPTSQGDDAMDAGMIFLGGHRTRPNWSPQEDLILLQHVARHGTRNWGSLQASGALPLRDQKACCNRFILLKKRCIKDKRSLSHLLHRAKESVVAPEPSNQDNQIAASSSATPAFSSQLQLPAVSGSGLGLNSHSRFSFKSGSPTSTSAIAAAAAAFNAPSAIASPTVLGSPVSLIQQQQQLHQALADYPYSVQSGLNASNMAMGSGNFSGVPLLQMPSLNSSTPLSMSTQLANLKSRLALQPGSLLAQALRLTQQPDFASVAHLPLLANVRKLAKSPSSSSLTAAASAPAAVGSPPHSSAPSGCTSSSGNAATFSAAGAAASEPMYARRSSLSSTGACVSPLGKSDAADGAYGSGRLASVARMPSFDVSSVCTGSPAAPAAGTAAGALADSVVPSTALPVGTAVSGRAFAGGGGGVEGGGDRAGAAGICAGDAFAAIPTSSFTALLNSSSSSNHHLASMVAAAPGAAAAAAAPAPSTHTWRPQGNARCLQQASLQKMQVQQEQVAYQFQQQALIQLQQQQQQQQSFHENQPEMTQQQQEVQQEQGLQQVTFQRPDVMLEAFSSARTTSHDRQTANHNSIDCQNQPQQTLDAFVSSGSLEAVVSGNGRISEFPLTAFDDQKPLAAAEFQSDPSMLSSLSNNGMFVDMPASFLESEMLQAIQDEMEMLSSIVNA
ncbi:hypothetical protein CLOP_g2676 [Closterium sp. NIES-67]|nr:hypothetical protein CLOP_g25533 [Closterium sp. NIES-67]GJP71882.1 hypothetical protein CLOP_g2676 [Closterium sp. NIES-67]